MSSSTRHSNLVQTERNRHWTSVEALLLNGYMLIKGSPTLRSLLKGWDNQIQLLNFHLGTGRLPRNMSSEQLLLLSFHDKLKDEDYMIDLRRFLVSRKIKQVGDLVKENGTWWAAELIINRVRSTRGIGSQAFLDLHGDLTAGEGLADITMDCYEAWRWTGPGKRLVGLSRMAPEWSVSAPS